MVGCSKKDYHLQYDTADENHHHLLSIKLHCILDLKMIDDHCKAEPEQHLDQD